VATTASLVAAAAVTLAVLLLSAGAGFLIRSSLRDRRLQQRLRLLQVQVAPARSGPSSTAVEWLRHIGEALRRRALFSERDMLDLERTVAAAGLNPQRAVSTFVGFKVTLLCVTPPVAYAAAVVLGLGHELLAAALGGALGMMSPNWLLGRMRNRYIKELRRGLPDALDLMVVCAEAGLGLETAVDRVAREIGRSNRAVAAEFSLFVHELRVLPDRRMALARLSDRAVIDDLKRLTGTLAQTMRFGTPLAQALRSLAAEARQDRMIRLETRAARLPAMMVLPMIMFIMPVLFMVLAGPPIIALLQKM
jgi:tight adherence protein C